MEPVLCGDIGGTHTRLALIRHEQASFQIAYEKHYSSRDYPDFTSILQHYPNRHSVRLACFGIAGPVIDNRCQATNLPWQVDAAELANRFGWQEAWLLNDLEANAWGIQALSTEQLLSLQQGNPSLRGNQAIIAAGTGLGEAGIYFNGAGFRPFATEGGHCDFAPRSDLDIELFKYLRQRHGHVSWERIVCGPGLVILHNFLRQHRRTPTPAWLLDQMQQQDAAASIAQSARDGSDEICVQALHWFVELYGAEAGNLALKQMASGGLFIGGGIAPKIIDFLKNGRFMRSFLDKGRMTPLLEQMPVKVILEERTALLGAAVFASNQTLNPSLNQQR